MATITDTVMIVPTYNETAWNQATTLDGATFQLSFTYSQVEDCYYLSVSDLEGSAIYVGIKITCGTFILRLCADSDRAPAGDFWCYSNIPEDQTPPRLGELDPDSGRCVLTYIPVSLIP